MFIIGKYTQHQEIKDSPRRRTLARWNPEIIDAFLYEQPIKVLYLTGQTITEADGYHPPLRFTQTSPIVGLVNDIAITASGSQYKLTDPKPGYPDLVSLLNTNSWIQGDNWAHYTFMPHPK